MKNNTKQVMILNFDGVYTDEGEFKILESGGGISKVGYPSAKDCKNDTTIEEKIFESLLQLFDHLYIVSIKNPEKAYESFDISKQFVAAHHHQLTSFTVQELIDRKDKLNANGVILINDNSRELRMIVPHHFTFILQRSGVHLPIINNSMMWYHFCNKVFMSDIIRDISPNLTPKQILVHESNVEDSFNALAEFKSDYVVFKPINATRAQGVFVVKKTNAKTIMKWLSNDQQESINNIPLEDHHTLERLFQLKKLMKECDIRYFLLQEYTAPKQISVENRNFRPTIRVVVIACYDTATHKIEIRMPHAYYKLPPSPVSSNSLLWQETISFSKLSHEIEQLQKLKDKVSLTADSFKEFKHPFRITMLESIKESIRVQLNKYLDPVFKYLFKTREIDYYKKASALAGMRQHIFDTIPSFVHKEITDETCIFLKKNNQNVIFVLLLNLSSYAKYQIPLISHPYLVPKNMGKLLIRYHAVFGDVHKKHYIAILSEIVRNNIDILFRNNICKEERELIQQILKAYSQKNFTPISAFKIYDVAAKRFRQGDYSLAKSWFIKANALFAKGSKGQATCYYSLASCHIKLNNYAAAMAAAKTALDIRKQLFAKDADEVSRAAKKLENANILLSADKGAQIGIEQFKQSAYPNAIKSLTLAINQHTNIQESSLKLALYYYYLGSCYLESNKHDDAITNYQQCLNMRTELLGEHHSLTKKVAAKLENTINNNSKVSQKIAPV